jgi:CheY-like chemotaxis protein
MSSKTPAWIQRWVRWCTALDFADEEGPWRPHPTDNGAEVHLVEGLCMDGMQTLEALRGLPEVQDVPIIFMTARVQQHELVEYRQCGAVAVIEKPFDPRTLHEHIYAIWGEYVRVTHGSATIPGL